MERSGIAIWRSALLFELFNSLPDLLFQFLHISQALGCRYQLLYGRIFRSLLRLSTKSCRERKRRNGLDWIESPEDWHRFQKLILPLSVEKWKRHHNSAVTVDG
jgi:hypothetical protein